MKNTAMKNKVHSRTLLKCLLEIILQEAKKKHFILPKKSKRKIIIIHDILLQMKMWYKEQEFEQKSGSAQPPDPDRLAGEEENEFQFSELDFNKIANRNNR